MKKRIFVMVLALTLSLCAVNAGTFTVRASETTGSAAADEAVTHSLDDETFSRLVDFIQEKWDAGDLENADDIRAAIAEGEEEFGFDLSADAENTIVNVVEKLNGFDIDSDLIADKARELYDTYGDTIVNNVEKVISEEMKEMGAAVGDTIKEQLVEPAKNAAAETAKSVAKNFFSDLKNSVVNFVKNIFHM